VSGKYGSGEILNPRDNAMAAAYKFVKRGRAVRRRVMTRKQSDRVLRLYLLTSKVAKGAADDTSAIAKQMSLEVVCADPPGRAWRRAGADGHAHLGQHAAGVKREWKSVR